MFKLWPQIRQTEPVPMQLKLEEPSPYLQIKVEDVEAPDNFMSLFQQNEIALIREFCDTLNKTNAYKSINFVDIEGWLHPATKVTEDECLDEDEIVQIIMEDNAANQLIKAKSPQPEKPRITHAEAQASLKKVIEYCSQNSHYSREQRLALITVREALKAESTTAAPPAPVETIDIQPFDFVSIADNQESEYNASEK